MLNRYFVLFLLFTNVKLYSFSQNNSPQNEYNDSSIVQFYGVVMGSDSLRGIPLASVVVLNKGRGTITNYDGVFSIVAFKGEKIKISCVGYKPQIIQIPKNLKGEEYSIIQILVNDTLTLPATILKPRLTREQWERDFVNSDIKDDLYETARKNTTALNQTLLYRNLPVDGGEAYNVVFKQNEAKYYSNGQIPPQNIFNPFAWSEFIKAWKRGDYRRKN